MSRRITIVGGAFGSGKTEFALGYALKLVNDQPNQKVGLVDLDIVNPYFRSRDLAEKLQPLGLDVISTALGMEHADLPALSPRIYAFLQNRAAQVVFDVGGDPAGSRALGRFEQYFDSEEYDFWLVMNPFRPDTSNIEKATTMITALQTASKLQATGIITNINLGLETTLSDWQLGQEFIQKIAKTAKLPVVYDAVTKFFYQNHRDFLNNYPVFPLELQMRTPWNE